MTDSSDYWHFCLKYQEILLKRNFKLKSFLNDFKCEVGIVHDYFKKCKRLLNENRATIKYSQRLDELKENPSKIFQILLGQNLFYYQYIPGHSGSLYDTDMQKHISAATIDFISAYLCLIDGINKINSLIDKINSKEETYLGTFKFKLMRLINVCSEYKKEMLDSYNRLCEFINPDLLEMSPWSRSTFWTHYNNLDCEFLIYGYLPDSETNNITYSPFSTASLFLLRSYVENIIFLRSFILSLAHKNKNLTFASDGYVRRFNKSNVDKFRESFLSFYTSEGIINSNEKGIIKEIYNFCSTTIHSGLVCKKHFTYHFYTFMKTIEKKIENGIKNSNSQFNKRAIKYIYNMQQTDNKEYWKWDEFKAAMDEHLLSHEHETEDLLQLVQECDKIVSKIVDRPLSYAHERPQDFVVALLATRSFRLYISTIRISLSGYPEIAPNLTRTIWEIGLWLFLIQNDPIGASLGFLLSGVEQEIEIMENDIQQRSDEKKHLGNLPKNLQTWKDYKETLEDIIRKHGLSLEAIWKKYKRISPWKVCKNFGLEHAYKINYAFMSGHVHERGFANEVFLDESQSDVRKFVLGPVCSGCIAGVVDALYTLIANLCVAAAIIGEFDLQEKCREIRDRISRR